MGVGESCTRRGLEKELKGNNCCFGATETRKTEKCDERSSERVGHAGIRAMRATFRTCSTSVSGAAARHPCVVTSPQRTMTAQAPLEGAPSPLQ